MTTSVQTGAPSAMRSTPAEASPARNTAVRAAAEAAGESTYVVGRIEAGAGVVRYENEGQLL